MTVDIVQRNKGRRDLLILIGIFLTPIIVALVLYQNLDNWRITSVKNHGNLIEPAVLLGDIALRDSDGQPFRFAELRGKWLLVQLGSAECDEVCAQNLYVMRQSRLAVGQDLHRVKRLYVSLEGAPGDSLREQLARHPGLKLVHGDRAASAELAAAFRQDVGQGAQLQALYIVDPRGYVMMSYPQGFAPRGLIKDLSLLLKFAQAG